jgi:DNA-directed RNA polymerase subunit RPC12/RpoP
MEFFRFCPECGRRFHIKLVGKALVSVNRTSRPKKVVTNINSPARYAAAPSLIVVQDDKPVIIDHEEFQYAYKCSHCGHQWTEIREETRREQ